jgi:outer membrane protein OmpA-like peptidoglycan-associated protein
MLTRLLAAAAMLALPHAALAGPSYSADDIEAFFSKNKPAKTRAICIGTSSACNDQQAEAADPGGFDMLITFELGSDRLSSQAQENLSEFAKALTGNSLANAQFNIEGHTDARGSDGFNLNLSNRRAESVVRYLESLGVSRDRLQAQGYGESRPRVDDPFAAINRRVEATIKLQ